MDFQFSDPTSAEFTQKREGTTFSDFRKNSLFKKILTKLGIKLQLDKSPHGSWLW